MDSIFSFGGEEEASLFRVFFLLREAQSLSRSLLSAARDRRRRGGEEVGTSTTMVDQGPSTTMVDQGPSTTMIDQGPSTTIIGQGASTSIIGQGASTMMIDHLADIQRAVDLLVEMVYSLVQSQVCARKFCNVPD